MLENLDRLKIFHHVFSSGSIVAAANILHVSQSAVSQSIRKLEQEVNTPLFTRIHKQLIPTTAGKRLYEIVHPFILSLGSYLKDLEFSKDHPAGELYIGSPPEFGKTYLPAIVANFREQYPDVTFSLQLGTPEELLPRLREGAVDLALVDLFLTQNTNIGPLDSFHFTPVVEEEVILACSSAYYEKYMQLDQSFDSLIRQNYISYKEDLQTILQWFKHHFSKPNVNICNVLTVDSHDAVIMAIKNSIGLGVVASHLIDKSLNSGVIRHITTNQNEILNSISLVKLQDKIPTLTENIFEDHLIENIEKMFNQSNTGIKILTQ